jgi:hypothetical protein
MIKLMYRFLQHRYTLKYAPHPEHPRVRPGRGFIYPDSQSLPIGYWDTAAYFNLVRP